MMGVFKPKTLRMQMHAQGFGVSLAQARGLAAWQAAGAASAASSAAAAPPLDHGSGQQRFGSPPCGT